jgi:acetyltransferase-like isoleucine patch superfamily enzyme
MVCAETLIESFVFIGPGVSFTNNSPIGHLRDLPSTINGAKLRLGCAIGGGSTICPGVEIGEESIIGAGAVVTKNIPSRIIAVGNPAKKFKDVEPISFIKEEIRKQYEI